MALAVKDPDARVDYGIDWGADYIDEQVIIASSWQVEPVEPGGMVVEGSSHDLLRSAVRVAGGIAGHMYQLINIVTLSDGQRDERSIAIRVDAR